MQISLGKALCTFCSFGGVKKENPLKTVVQSLTRGWVVGCTGCGCKRFPGRKAASGRKASPPPE